MRKILPLLLAFNLLVSISHSQKFLFGKRKASSGVVRVTADSRYNDKAGYGFEAGVALKETAAGIGADGPFFFSVKLAEGNYNIRAEVAAAAVRVECRRMMVQDTVTGKVAFTVHVRDTLIRDVSGKVIGTVRIKPREKNYRHWDNLLTIEFNGRSPAIRSLEITPAREAVTVFLAGNSTVVDQDREPWAAWGQMIPAFFVPGKVAVANYAESGEALSSFIRARRLEKIISLMQPGDYLFIEFGHNDQKQKGAGIGPFTSYKRDLLHFIRETRKKGGIPVLVTSMHRRSFDTSGRIINTLGDYPEAVRLVAREQDVALIDLNAMSRTLYEAWGETASLQAFVHYPANTFPGQEQALQDNTHFSTYGAWQLAKCIVKGIRDSGAALADLLRDDVPSFDPAHPDDITTWYWPLSPLKPARMPDGN